MEGNLNIFPMQFTLVHAFFGVCVCVWMCLTIKKTRNINDLTISIEQIEMLFNNYSINAKCIEMVR